MVETASARLERVIYAHQFLNAQAPQAFTTSSSTLVSWSAPLRERDTRFTAA